jgi:hypothetical protein
VDHDADRSDSAILDAFVTASGRAGLLLLAAALAAVGCGPAASPASTPAAPAQPVSLATSLATGSGTWAVAVMGGSAASHNNFWQLFVRPTRTSTWRLATPPGVASNGGLVLATPGGGTVVAGFRPSQNLAYSPLATTHDNGTTWSPSLLDTGLADVPGALAAAHNGRLLALLTNGTAELSATGGTHWARLATLHSLARSAPGRRCGLESLSAAAFSPSGMPLLAGTCRHRQTAGLFAFTGGAWHPAGPTLPASLSGQPTRVLGLTVAGNRDTALLAVGAGRDTVLMGAWSPGNGHWELSPSLPLGGAQVASFSTGPRGAIGIVLTGRAGVVLPGPSSNWQWLPFLPANTQTLTLGPRAQVDALAAAGTTFSDWTRTPGSAAWAKTQTLHVPVQYRSSG